ncbi:hypothetical protein BT69DRAFT_1347863 [Atractiella rhizophila]|nr:hypothetical protein BT69DRAFT_1347863 [Atractiella rhizophila]
MSFLTKPLTDLTTKKPKEPLPIKSREPLPLADNSQKRSAPPSALLDDHAGPRSIPPRDDVGKFKGELSAPDLGPKNPTPSSLTDENPKPPRAPSPHFSPQEKGKEEPPKKAAGGLLGGIGSNLESGVRGIGSGVGDGVGYLGKGVSGVFGGGRKEGATSPAQAGVVDVSSNVLPLWFFSLFRMVWRVRERIQPTVRRIRKLAEVRLWVTEFLERVVVVVVATADRAPARLSTSREGFSPVRGEVVGRDLASEA